MINQTIQTEKQRRASLKAVFEESLNEHKIMPKIFIGTFIGCLLAIFLIISSYYVYDKTFNYQTVITTEKWTADGSIKVVDSNAKVTCEDGIVISTFYNYINLYSCLSINNGRCSGKDKICLIETRERVRK